MRIVFIHLGSSKADCMLANIDNLLSRNLQIEIDVILSRDIAIPSSVKSKVEIYRYSSTPKIENLFNSLELDGSYRQGFWRYSLERLIALTEHHKLFPQDQLLHIESDILLLESFPFKSFERIQNLAWSILDDDRDVAALLFSPNFASSAWLQEQIIELLNSKSTVNDMQILSMLSNKFPTEVTILPTLPKGHEKIFSNSSNVSDFNKKRASENFDVFAGIFDAAPIGIWLTGSHGVNSFGISRRYDDKLVANSNSMINPSGMALKYLEGFGLYSTSSQTPIPIHTLHIHSKNTKIFSGSGPKTISKYILDSRNKRLARRFSSKVLWDLIVDNYKKKTLIRFLSWLPPFNKYRIIRDILQRRES